MARKQPADHHAVVGLQPFLDHAERAVELPGRTLRCSTDVVLVHDQHVAAALVAALRSVGHEYSVLLLLDGHPDAHEEAGQQHAVGIGDDAAHGERTGRLVDGGRGVVEIALVRIAVLGLQADLHRKPRQIGRAHAAAAGFGAHLQHVLFVDVEVYIDRIERDDGRQLRRRGRADEFADRHQMRGGDAVEGRATLV